MGRVKQYHNVDIVQGTRNVVHHVEHHVGATMNTDVNRELTN